MTMKYLISQFGNPRGVLGWIAGFSMLYRKSNRERIRWVVKKMEILPDDVVLDIGCGPGFSIREIESNYKCKSLYGIDRSALMIKFARRRADFSIKDTELVCASVTHIPKFPNSFTKVLAVNSFYFWPDRVTCLRNIHERMKTHGKIAILHQSRKNTKSGDASSKYIHEIQKSLEDANFRIEAFEVSTRFGRSPVNLVIGVKDN